MQCKGCLNLPQKVCFTSWLCHGKQRGFLFVRHDIAKCCAVVFNAKSDSNGAAIRGLVFFEIWCCLCTLFLCALKQTSSLSTPWITIQGETNIPCFNIQCTRRYVRGTYFVPKATPIDLPRLSHPPIKLPRHWTPAQPDAVSTGHLHGLVGGRCISSTCRCPDLQHVRRHNSCTHHVPSVCTAAWLLCRWSHGSRRMSHSVYEKKTTRCNLWPRCLYPVKNRN